MHPPFGSSFVSESANKITINALEHGELWGEISLKFSEQSYAVTGRRVTTGMSNNESHANYFYI